MKKTGMPPICAASRFSYNTMNPCFHLCVISDQKDRLDRHDLIEFLLGDGYIRIGLFQIIFYNVKRVLHRLGAPLTDSTLHPLYSHRMKITGRNRKSEMKAVHIARNDVFRWLSGYSYSSA